MERYPHGAEGSSFFQKRVPDNAPDWLTTTIVSTPNGTSSRALVIADLAHVAWAVNLGCLGFHVWPARRRSRSRRRAAHRSRPARPAPTSTTRAVAHSFTRCSTSSASSDTRRPRASTASTCTCGSAAMGSVPGAIRGSRVRARELARRHPDQVTDAWWKEERGERIFVDFNQNAPHKTVFGAWCVRVRDRARRCRRRSAWDELDSIDPDAQTIASVPGARRRARRSVGRHRHRAAVARAAARDLRPRHRQRHDRRALAAGVPEDAGRAAASGAQPGQEAERPPRRNKSLASYITRE